MKRILALLLILSLLVGCSGGTAPETADLKGEEISSLSPVIPSFTGLNDAHLLTYLEDTVYSELVLGLNSEAYFVDHVDAVYVSREYLEDLSYHTKENIYFGYSLSALDAYFSGTRYVFTMGEDGQTTVKAFEEYDDSFDRALTNVAIGAGVILLCVTVSAVTGGLGAPAVSMIFAASAKTGAAMALSSGVISGLAEGIVTGIQTESFDEALEAAALAGSESFKWGAISGSVSGGISKTFALRGATLNGLSMNEAARIQKESGYPLSVIKQFHNMDEYLVYRKAGLQSQMVGGKLALTRNIDLKHKSELAGQKVSNLERMRRGYAPIDPETGSAYQLHHVGQKSNATLAILTEAEHQGNASVLNIVGLKTEIDRASFSKIRQQFWIDFAAMFP